MFEFLKKIFGSETTATPVPYKVETPKVEVSNTVAKQATQAVVESIVPVKKPAKPKTEKKPAVKAKTARKPRAPKA
jgi:hypothetical protein